ncbi:hypothetical protein KIP69_15875 [Geobacter sulfurreducens]|uniref:hypothetical protein n=1 Tax=Geobacter sulfurreducens TaxID=35554 RepID=UPI0001E3430A|nr:hypothetical protein [Geobacter sulfurreducens]ADI86015.2 hypothetical protein KN400_3203 [Geobacter sulfurreducens KN400]AJY69495.1 hypothetical protein RW64_07655 [Geobacter sulfurreducens]QVW35050.1 hypothetical protein KIP69_15875 [Geobacter sulfurreducens]
MAPLSVLPGRVRFETCRLVGCEEECILLEESILSMHGVMEASASHRTGRVLVRFDEALVTRVDIEERLTRTLESVTAGERRTGAVPARRKNVDSGSSAGHFIVEMALHTLLPAPLDLLLPAAAAVLRR